METTESIDQINPEKAKKKKGKKILQNERVRTSFERLQLAWIRSSLTVMTIGVGAYEYYYGRIESGKAALSSQITGKETGLFLMSLSVVMMIFSLIQHIQSMRKLKEFYVEMRMSIATLITCALIILGLFLVLMVILRGSLIFG
jgi:uncharacterized membrane protein YidH (DUF202 family)